MGIKISEEGEYSIGDEAIEKATYSVYITEDAINEFSSSEDFVKTLKAQLKSDGVEVKASGFMPKIKLTVIKLYLFFA